MLYYLFGFCLAYGLYEGFLQTNKIKNTDKIKQSEKDYEGLLDFVFFSTNK